MVLGTVLQQHGSPFGVGGAFLGVTSLRGGCGRVARHTDGRLVVASAVAALEYAAGNNFVLSLMVPGTVLQKRGSPYSLTNLSKIQSI